MSSQLHDAHPPQTIRWPKSLYYQMAELGWFQDRRVELIRGEIIEMAPMGTLHFTATGLAMRALIRAFGDEYLVAPGVLDLTPDSEPEPDIAVYSQPLKELALKTPDTAVLVVEISDSSLKYDRTTKAELYAQAAIQDYWIINVRDSIVEVYRSPEPGDANGFGARYKEPKSFKPGDTISPLAQPDHNISVSDLLPPQPNS